ncbi:hypothetical protein [Aquimarina pacifica]|uniref:hypothetical protein n=1 Tax=Aquimarina pacifica TaxID=1296415 RepID=UPI0004729B51|nr:hypothetical protein [Aquimarina pacifica]
MQRKKRPVLGQKIKEAIQTLHVDVFGYEKTTTTNILGYFEQLSKTMHWNKEKILVRIFTSEYEIHARIYNQGCIFREIPMRELILLFTNSHPLPGVEDKVKNGIHSFFTSFAQEHHIPIASLHICISVEHNSVTIQGCYQTQCVAVIPLRVLIQHFTQ